MPDELDPLALALAALRQRQRLRATAEAMLGALDDGASGEELEAHVCHMLDVLGSVLLVERVRRGDVVETWELMSDC